MQLPLAHSKLADAGDAIGQGHRRADRSTRAVVGARRARQQSVAEPHTAPIGRQGPRPRVAPSPVLSQTPQQWPGPPEVQSSPDPRHVAIGSITHLPFAAAVVDVTLVRAALHVGGAAGPLAQALRARAGACVAPERAAVARARAHRPGGRHCGETDERRRAGGGLERPLQHAALATYRRLRQGCTCRGGARRAGAVSRAALGVTPQAASRAWQLADGARASHSSALASVPKPPASAPARGARVRSAASERARRRELDVFGPAGAERGHRGERQGGDATGAHGSSIAAQSAASRVTGASSRTRTPCTSNRCHLVSTDAPIHGARWSRLPSSARVDGDPRLDGCIQPIDRDGHGVGDDDGIEPRQVQRASQRGFHRDRPRQPPSRCESDPRGGVRERPQSAPLAGREPGPASISEHRPPASRPARGVRAEARLDRRSRRSSARPRPAETDPPGALLARRQIAPAAARPRYPGARSSPRERPRRRGPSNGGDSSSLRALAWSDAAS